MKMESFISMAGSRLELLRSVSAIFHNRYVLPGAFVSPFMERPPPPRKKARLQFPKNIFAMRNFDVIIAYICSKKEKMYQGYITCADYVWLCNDM